MQKVKIDTPKIIFAITVSLSICVLIIFGVFASNQRLFHTLSTPNVPLTKAVISSTQTSTLPLVVSPTETSVLPGPTDVPPSPTSISPSQTLLPTFTFSPGLLQPTRTDLNRGRATRTRERSPVPTLTKSFTPSLYLRTATNSFTPSLSATSSFTSTATSTFTPSWTPTSSFTYTSSFTPSWTSTFTPTTSFTPSNTPTSSSTPSSTATSLPAPSYSLRFFGTGSNDIDRVKIPLLNSSGSSLPVNVGAADFTIEFWLRFSPGENNSPACSEGEDNWIYGNIIFDRDIFGSPDYGDYGISLYGGRIAFGVHNGSTGYTICGNSYLAENQWHHIAVTRKVTGEMSIFVNGMLDRQYSNGPTGDISYNPGRSVSWANEPFLVIGAEKHDYNSNLFPSFSGWIDEIRISIGIRYTGTFIPPTAPFSPDANTVALYHFDEGSGITILDALGISNGVRKVGGPNNGPVYSPLTPFSP